VIEAGLRFRRPSLHLIFIFFCFLVSMLLSSCFLNLLCSLLPMLDVYLGSLSISTACQLSIRCHSEAYHPPFRASPVSPLDIIGERLHSIVPCPHGFYQNVVCLIFFSKSNEVYSYYLFRDQPTGNSASGRGADRTAQTAASPFESSLSHRFWRSIDVENTHAKKKHEKTSIAPSGSSVLVRHHPDETKKRCAPRKIIQVYATTRALPMPAPRRSNKGTREHARTTCSDDMKANGCHRATVVCGQGPRPTRRLTWRGLRIAESSARCNFCFCSSGQWRQVFV
jgi:hypothetical protein